MDSKLLADALAVDSGVLDRRLCRLAESARSLAINISNKGFNAGAYSINQLFLVSQDMKELMARKETLDRAVGYVTKSIAASIKQ